MQQSPKSDKMASRDEKESQDCCRFLTKAEKVLLILLIFTSVALLALLIFIAVVNLKSRYLKNCESSDCVQTAAQLLESIDFDQAPCENFHKYVCGKHEDEDFQTRRDEKSANIRQLLQDSELLKVPRKFYEACTNTTNNSSVLLEIINELGGWPILLGSEWPDTFHWLKFTARARSLGVKSDWFIRFDSHLLQDENESTKLLKIGMPPWSASIPLTSKQNYYEAMVKVAITLESSKSVAWRELRKVVNFEDNLRITGQRARNRSLDGSFDLNVERTLDDLNSLWHDVNLPQILNDVYQGFGDFDGNSTVILESENYLLELNSLLIKTSRRTQANFAIWKVIEWYLPYLSDEIRTAYEHFSPIESRQDFCLSETLKRYYKDIQTVGSSKTKDDQSQNQIQEMVDLISKELDLKEIQVTVGGPNHDLNNNQDMDLVSDNILKMVNEIKYERENDFFECLSNELPSNCTKQEYTEMRDIEEITYDPESKIIYFSNDILRSSLYSGNLPNYLNYASLGPVILSKILDNATVESLPTLEFAYLGYLRKFQLSGMEKRLPGLDLTQMKLFWIYAGYFACHRNDNSTLVEEIVDSDYFRTDFNC